MLTSNPAMMPPSKLVIAGLLVLACSALYIASAAPEMPEGKIYDDSEPVQSPPPLKRRLLRQEHYLYEFIALGCLILYMLNMAIGRYNNDAIAKRWVAIFARPGGLFDANFSVVGTGQGQGDFDIIYKETSSKYKLYASGRRYCASLTADIQLNARQDLLSMIWYLISPREELINIEVLMNEACMPPAVLAVAIPRVARSLLKDCDDLKTFAKQLNEVPKDKIRAWPPGLKVIAEQSAVFYELFADSKLEHVFSEEALTTGPMKLFRSLHISSVFTSTQQDGSPSQPKQVLRLCAALPPARHMEELGLLMALVPYFIDLLGSYQMPADLRRRALDNRARAAAEAFKKESEQRMEAAQQRKAERLQADRARMAKQGREAVDKWEEKQRQKEMRRRMSGKVLKVG